MTTFRFRGFKVYQDARKFRRTVRAMLKKFPATEKFTLCDQINRSCLSILLNIAEGSAKTSDRDFARFLTMSIASVSEVVACFDLAYDDGIVSEMDSKAIEREAEEIAKQLGGFIKILKKLKVKS